LAGKNIFTGASQGRRYTAAAVANRWITSDVPYERQKTSGAQVEGISERTPSAVADD
jgi:hypothetical protein